jgi:hypothetical protein
MYRTCCAQETGQIEERWPATKQIARLRQEARQAICYCCDHGTFAYTAAGLALSGDVALSSPGSITEKLSSTPRTTATGNIRRKSSHPTCPGTSLRRFDLFLGVNER